MTKLSLALLASPALLFAQVSVVTYHNDLDRTGQNPSETTLNTSNVSVATFGKLFSRSVVGQIYAQPLYVANVLVPGQGAHNVVYVATENNNVYAFDADSPSASAALWQVNLGPSLPSTAIDVTRNLQPEIGITGTPTIDSSTNTLYVVAETYENSQAIFRLHALDITTGSEKFNGPVVIQGSVPGTSSDSSGGVLTFTPLMHWQRVGLLLWGGNVYIAFGSHEDQPPYHGWIFGYTADSLQRSMIYCSSPNGNEGGIWQGGVGPALDTLTGFMYLETGNGTMDANTGQGDYGDSILKLDTSNNLNVFDYFSPSNQSSLSGVDADLGSGGVLLIPETTLGLGEGKDGTVYLFNRNGLGQYNPNIDQVAQEWQATYSFIQTNDAGFFGGPAYYNSQFYVWGRRDNLKVYAFNGSSFNTTPVEGSTTIPDGYSNEPAMSISANGTTAGSGILWATYSTNGDDPNGGASPGILVALDANNVTNELWDSNQNQTRDYSGSWAKWVPPTIANGKVYLATFDNVLNVYGVLPSGSGGGSGGALAGSGTFSSAAVNLTSEGSADWIHWGDGTLNRKAGVSPQLSTYTSVEGGGTSVYNNDPRPVSWSDGIPVASSTDNTNGVFVPGTGQGFSITAPADTTTRTLVVHVGGWLSAGQLTAHLSDNSAPDYVDITTTANGQYDRNYTLTYTAASAGQTLTVSWTMSSGSGNVTLNAAALSGSQVVTQTASNVLASGGTPQSATVNTAFATALQATVTDSSGNPVSGVTVTFTAPGSGASGSFAGGSATASVTTGSNGIAIAPVFSANSQAGSYAVTATVGTIGASFNLTNTAVVTGGALTGSGTSSSAAVNLTAEGSADWIHWGDGSVNRKAGVSPQLSTYTSVEGGGTSVYNNDPRPVNWSDGTPTGSSANNTNGLYIPGTGQGFSFTAPADTTTRTLVVHVGGWYSTGTLTAHLSDNSAPDYIDVTTMANGQYDRNYTLTYTAASAGQTLTVSWTMSSGSGNVTLNAAALSGSQVVTQTASNVLASGGTSQSATVNTAFAAALQASVTDSSGNPVSGVTVTFTAPGSGASGSFAGGSATASVTTGSNGIAITPAFSANGQAGSYTVTATVATVSAGASFNLTNTAVVVGSGALTGSGTSSSGVVNLTAEGSTDWIHWGDGTVNRKAGVTPQLSTYTSVSGGGVYTYNNDPRPVNWSDGTPTASSANNTNGVFVPGTGQGFSFTAPADTTTRTLVVHVGGWLSAGQLTAHLSDNSAPDYIDVTTMANGQYDRNYTLTYTAAGAGQTLTVSWTMSSGSGNVTLNAAALSGSQVVTQTASNVLASGGTPQSATVNTAFATALQATVTDSSGNPVSGVTVTFTAPGSGASGTFAGGSATASVTTGSNGIAITPAFSANGQAGSYTVTATVATVSAGASFNLTNTAVVVGSGALTGSGTSSSGVVNLTAEGSTDWIHWGDGTVNRKAGVTPQLSTYTSVSGGGVYTYNNDPRPVNWSDGTPSGSSANNTGGVFVPGTGQGFSFTAPADTTTRTLVVHVGGWLSAGQLTAHLSDSSAPDYIDVTTMANGQYDRNYTLTYTAAGAGQTLTVSWTMTSGGGNITLNAAALSGSQVVTQTASNVVVSGGTSQSATVNTAFAAALQATVTDSSGNPVSGVTVTFTAPGSGASGSFAGGSATASVVTGVNGIAIAPAFSANGQAGSYTVTATVATVGAGASFNLTNTAVVVGSGALMGSGTSSSAAVNLTAEGSTDWIHWDEGTVNHKAGVSPQLSTYTSVNGGGVSTYSNDPRPVSWSDGTPTVISANNTGGVYIPGSEQGFSLTAPADTTTRTLIVHVGGWLSTGQLTAHLSDNSAPDYVDVTITANGQYDRNYTLTYTAASAGQTLTVSWTMTSGAGNVTLNAAALQ